MFAIHRLSHSQSSFPASASRVGHMNADAAVHTWDRAEIAFGRFSESVYAAVETVVLNMETCELKMATKAKQHHSLFAKSSMHSCLIQKTLVFITHTWCTRDTEPTAAHNKHGCGYTIPLSIYITSSLVSMQIKLIPHRIGDLTGTVWNEAPASRLDGRWGVIIITGCRVMTSSATVTPVTACLPITYHSCLLESLVSVPSLTLLSPPWSTSLIHSTWADSKEEEHISCFLWNMCQLL